MCCWFEQVWDEYFLKPKCPPSVWDFTSFPFPFLLTQPGAVSLSCSTCMCISVLIFPQQRALLFLVCLEEECKAVAQWHHLAVGCTGGTQRWWCLCRQWVDARVPHPSLMWVMVIPAESLCSLTFTLRISGLTLFVKPQSGGAFPCKNGCATVMHHFGQFFSSSTACRYVSMASSQVCQEEMGLLQADVGLMCVRERADSSVCCARFESSGRSRDRGSPTEIHTGVSYPCIRGTGLKS